MFNLNIKDLKIIDTIGQGSSGYVERAIHEATNTIYALKTIPLNTDEKFRSQVYLELNTLISCNSEYIIKCYGAYLKNGMITIPLEYMDIGTLQDIIKKRERIPEVILGIIIV